MTAPAWSYRGAVGVRAKTVKQPGRRKLIVRVRADVALCPGCHDMVPRKPNGVLRSHSYCSGSWAPPTVAGS